MIPKKIHYCWFGGNPKPKLAQKCIKSWKKYCKDYEIIEWNENNYNLDESPLYVKQAYDAKKWAFVTDYVRLQVVYEYGGIYLDTDVELLNSLDLLLDYNAYFGFEDGIHVATGLGFGAEANSFILKEMMDDYIGIPFIKEDGSFDNLPCPQRNTRVLVEHGLIQDNSKQNLNGCLILPKDYFCPIEYSTGKKELTQNTLSIHHFSASWQTPQQQKKHKENVRIARKKNFIDYIQHIPNRIIRLVIGKRLYELLKTKIKGEKKCLK